MLDFLMDAAFEFGSALGDACRGAADACFYPAPRHYYPRPSWADGRKWYPLFAEVEEYFEQVVGPTLKYSVDTASWKFQKSYYMNAWLNLERVHAAAQGSLARADRYDDWREIREEADNMRSVLNRMIELAMRMMADLEVDDDTFHLIYKFRPIKDRLESYKAQLDWQLAEEVDGKQQN